MLINKYITQASLKTFAGILAILLFIGLSNRLVAYITKATQGQLPIEFVLQALACYAPEFLAYLLPLALFLGLLITFSRLSESSELAIIITSPGGRKILTKLFKALSIIFLILSSVCVLWLMPFMNQTREQILSSGQEVSVLNLMQPGGFQSIANNKLIIYIEDNQNNILDKIFIQEVNTGNLIKAEQAKIIDNNLVLYNGSRVEYLDNNKTRIINFSKYYKPLDQLITPVQLEMMPSTLELIKAGMSQPKSQAELHWRLGLIILNLYAVYLAWVIINLYFYLPRGSKWAGFLPGIVIYFGYFAGLIIGRNLLATGALPVWLGLWPVHLIIWLSSYYWLRCKSNV